MIYEKLESLFVINPLSAIEETKRFITSITGFKTFQDFLAYHIENTHFSYCPKAFSNDYKFEMSIFCLDCARNNDDLCFICLPCFLNGNHEGHNYFIFPGFIGKCECGDKSHMKSSGFCSKHQVCDDDKLEYYLDEKLRTNLTELIFKAAFSALRTFKDNDFKKIAQIIQFLSIFFDLGDGFRRLFTKTLTEQLDFTELIMNIPNYSSQFNTFLSIIFSYLLHDQLFMRHFSKNVYSLISDKILKDTPNCMIKLYDDINYNEWFPYFYQCFSKPICQYNIEHNNWDWVTFCIDLITYFKELFIFVKNKKYKTFPLVFSIIKNLHFVTSIQPNEKTQEFFDKVVTNVFNSGTKENTDNETNDTIIVVSFKRFAFTCNLRSFYDFLSFFYYIFDCFKSKPNLKLDKLIDELDSKIDINPIFMINKNYVGKENGKKNDNDKLISRLIKQNDQSKATMSFFDKFKSTMKNIFHSYPSKFYKSFFNGASFYLSYPLYDSFCMIFKLDDLCRVKLARFLSMSKYQPLRIKLGIITMKRLLSTIYFDLSLADMFSSNLANVYQKVYESRKEAKFNLMPVSILQLLIGLQCNERIDDEFILKEFFSFELARELGLFDRVNRERIQKLFFAFFYVSLLIVIDRTLFHDNDNYNVTEEQIIFALKKGIHSIDQLNEMCDRNDKPGEYFITFNEILMKVATKSTNNPKDELENNNEEDDSNITLSQLKNNGNLNKHDNEEEDNEDEDDIDTNNNENNENNEVEENNNESHNNNNRREGQNSYIKPVNFYLKEEIECKLISSVIPINQQMSYMNIELSKNHDKLLKIQNFEPEETFFFKPTNNNDNNNNNNNNDNNNNDNDNNNNNNDNNNISVVIDSNELNICLKELLLTPTILAAVYDSFRTVEKYELQETNLNDHLAMNILILASKFIKEKSSETDVKALNEEGSISYLSLAELISKISQTLFNYRVEGKGDDEKAFIDNTMNPSTFASFLKTKFEPSNLPPKSIIDILIEKGQIGQEVLHQISLNVPIEELNEKTEKEKENSINVIHECFKAMQKQKAAKLKEDIMNQYSNIRNQYQFTESVSDSLLLSSSELFSPNKKVCSLCSESKKNEILSYPLYIYRTKLPFIFDKPPLVKKEVDCISVDDNEEDTEKDPDFVDMVKAELEINGDLQNESGLYNISKFKKTISEVYIQQQKERRDLKIGKEPMKRVTLGANFVVQFGSCPHPVHKSCVNDDEYICPIDRSMKNGFLPCLDEIPILKIFKDIQTFEANSTPLASNTIESINSFVDQFKSFFDCLNNEFLDVFVELIKSVSGLIETYEIRVRNLPNSLDSTKTKMLSRNLFLAVWCYYRIAKKPELKIDESRLTEFQKFIKLLIENDKVGCDNNNNEVKVIVSSLLNSFSHDISNVKLKEKMICLFLKRVCLAEYFLLNYNLCEDQKELIDWDEILTTENLSKRYNVQFTSIDVSKNEEFEFKPFYFSKLPKEFLKLAQSPYCLPIQKIGEVSLYNLLDYNYLIKYYDDFDDVRDENETDTSNIKSYENNEENNSNENNEENNSNENNEGNNSNENKEVNNSNENNEGNNSNENKEVNNSNENKEVNNSNENNEVNNSNENNEENNSNENKEVNNSNENNEENNSNENKEVNNSNENKEVNNSNENNEGNNSNENKEVNNSNENNEENNSNENNEGNNSNENKEVNNSNENNEENNSNENKEVNNSNENKEVNNSNENKEVNNSNENNEENNSNENNEGNNSNENKEVNNSNENKEVNNSNENNEVNNSNENNEENNSNENKEVNNSNENNEVNNSNENNEENNSNENNEENNSNENNEENNSNENNEVNKSNENSNNQYEEEENNYDDDDASPEVKKNRRGIQTCNAEFLPYLMTFYGKRRYPSVLMFTGAIASQIFLVDQTSYAALDTFYVDKTGCPDVNHLRFQALFLNEERYEKLIDQILSGDFSYNLEPLEKLRNDDPSE